MTSSPVEATTRISSLYSDHSRRLLKFLTGLTDGRQDLAEDLLQETMIRAWRNLESVPDQPENTRRWLFTVARRLAIDAARTRSARPVETSALDLARMPATDYTSGEVEAIHVFRQTVDGLSRAHRTVLAELYLHGRSTGEAAQLLGLPVGTVKSRAHYALRAVRDALSAAN
ncbi:sigma-70 family RNA polymerase sigma factor [Actinoplanes solisilvae]|uniref:sigma-70 family RNA polymerase sigma factor n=1 Tax=Actinoplanes solisilvae TaxID=2486853 RepID=UPI0021061772|nr:sigma-70 family RNA polymerase sigma factor [Actinoplanes solisilvae]